MDQATANNNNTEYEGFTTFEKVGGSTWTLENTPSQLIDLGKPTPWTIYDGTLSTSEDRNLGFITGGDLTIDGGIWQVTGTAFNGTTRAIVLGDTNDRPNGIEIFDQNNIFVYGLPIIGSGGLQKKGPGTLVLNGSSTYSGQTDVLRGMMVLGDDSPDHHLASILGDGYVAPGATLAGHGIIGGNVWNDGTVAPGYQDFGTLTIRGGYNLPYPDPILGQDQTFNSTGTIAIRLDGIPGQDVLSDHLQVDGQVYLKGTTLLLLKRDYEMVCGDKTQVIISNKGNFHDEINPLSLANFDKLMLFDNGTGWLYGVNVLKTQDLSALPKLNHNQKAIAKALSKDVLNPSNFIDDDKALDRAVILIISNCKLNGQRLDQLSPESYAGFVDYGIQVTRNYTRTAMGVPGPGIVPQPAPAPPAPDAKGGMVDAKGGMDDSKGGLDDSKGGLAKGGMPTSPAAPALRDTTVFGAFSHYDGNSSSSINGADYHIESNGGIAGARHTIGNLTFGGFIGIDDGEVSTSYLEADASGYVLGGFLSYLANREHNIVVDGGVTYGSYEFDGTRHTLDGNARFDGGDTDVLDVFGSVRGDVYRNDKLRLSPMLSLHYLQANVDGITESGAGTALKVDSMDQDAFLAELSLNLEYKAMSNLTLLGNIGYTHNFIDAERQVDAGFIQGHTPFSVIAPGMGEDIFSLGVGAIWNVTEALSVGLNYRAEFSADMDPSNSVGVSVSYSF